MFFQGRNNASCHVGRQATHRQIQFGDGEQMMEPRADQIEKCHQYELALLLEQCHLTREANVGITVDLVKAFNTIPREVVWIALNALKCPSWINRSQASFVNCQVRRFKIQSSIGKAIASDVGFPEGCALSVRAMALIDMLLDRWLTPIDRNHPISMNLFG